MPKKLLSVEDFRAAAREGEAPEAMVVRAQAEPVEMVADTRRVRFVFSDGAVDRMGDTIAPKGWQLDRYKQNPVALFGHDSSNIASVIGRGVNVGIQGDKLVGDIEFASGDVNPNAEMAFRMVEAGLLSAVSVGFMPIEFAFSTDKERPFGIDFQKQELLEISLVPVPANQNALIQARSLGIDTGPLAEWAERILDGEGRVPVPRAFLEDVFRAAKTPKATQQKYLTNERSGAPDWRTGLTGDLPLEDVVAWDGAAAAERMFAAAGFGGDAPDLDVIKTGFLVHDAANPMLKSSYKLPFADVINGELRAVTGGLRAAAARLPQSDAPRHVIDAAQGLLRRYGDMETKAGRKISAATAAVLQEIMSHHDAANTLAKGLVGDDNSNVETAPGGEPEVVHDPVLETIDPVKAAEIARRVRHAKALKLAVDAA